VVAGFLIIRYSLIIELPAEVPVTASITAAAWKGFICMTVCRGSVGRRSQLSVIRYFQFSGLSALIHHRRVQSPWWLLRLHNPCNFPCRCGWY
jgi:hypothetical protein